MRTIETRRDDHVLMKEGWPMLATRDLDAILDREFLELRGWILEVAAALDRLDRAPETPGHAPDARLAQVRQALEVLGVPEPSRVETIQRLFSLPYDPAWRQAKGLNPGL
jgi:hypothetical protein